MHRGNSFEVYKEEEKGDMSKKAEWGSRESFDLLFFGLGEIIVFVGWQE